MTMVAVKTMIVTIAGSAKGVWWKVGPLEEGEEVIQPPVDFDPGGEMQSARMTVDSFAVPAVHRQCRLDPGPYTPR